MNALPLDQRTRDLWAPQIESLNLCIPRIESEARLYTNEAENCKAYAPELVDNYLDCAEWATQRAQRARANLRQIQDYLAGKIAPWWCKE